MRKLLLFFVAIMACQALYSQVNTYPYNEGFEGASFPPSDWTNVNNGPDVDAIWERIDIGQHPDCTPHSGTYMAMFFSYSIDSGSVAYFITPDFTFPAGQYEVSLWMYRDDGYPNLDDNLQLLYMPTTGSDINLVINRPYTMDPVEAIPNMWYEYTYDLPAGNPSGGFMLIATSSYGNCIFIDDFSVRLKSSSGIDQSGKKELYLYPNPATDVVHINPGTLTLGEYSLDVITLQGQLVRTQRILNTGSDITVQTKDLAAGTYLFRLSGNGSSWQKLVCVE